MIGVVVKDKRSYIGDVDVTAWPDEHRVKYLEIVNATAKAQAEIKRIDDDQKRAEQSPEAVISRAEEERAQAEEEQKRRERITVDGLRWVELVRQQGRDRVKRLDTKEGLVVVRVPSEQETIDQGLAMQGIAPVERPVVAREYLTSMCLYPDAAEVRRIGSRWPGFWDDLDTAVRLLQSSREDEARPFG